MLWFVLCWAVMQNDWVLLIVAHNYHVVLSGMHTCYVVVSLMPIWCVVLYAAHNYWVVLCYDA